MANPSTMALCCARCSPALQAEFIDPRPKVKAYYEAVRARPSYAAACAPASSGLTALRLIVPALLKSKFAALTRRY
jgi:hypothetical protein